MAKDFWPCWVAISFFYKAWHAHHVQYEVGIQFEKDARIYIQRGGLKEIRFNEVTL